MPALLRRDEGSAGSQVEIRHPPADHGARGARLRPPPAPPGPRHGDREAARFHAPGARGRARRGFSPSVIEGSLGRVPQVAEGESLPQTVSVPVMGRIAAGVPIEAIQTRLARSRFHRSLLTKGEHYALEVKGDSMIDAGILDGDTIIVRKCDDASNGDIVVALVDEEEATLKRLRRRGDSIALEAANPVLRDAHLRPRPRARAGTPGRPDPPLLRPTRQDRRRRALASLPASASCSRTVGLALDEGAGVTTMARSGTQGLRPRAAATVSVLIERPSI